MTDEERKALVGVMKDQIESWEFEDPREDWWKWQHQYARAADQIEADGQRIAELEAENDRLRYHLDGALDTLQDAEVCSEDCVPCAEARAALGDKTDD